MNYEANTTKWKKGDIVIHDADAKEERMLMVVIGYTRDGLVKTEYIDRIWHYKNRYHNELKYLLDPARFGIVTDKPMRDG